MAGIHGLEIEIDRNACCGVGECVLRADRTFALDDEDCAKLLSPLDPHFQFAPDADGERGVLAAARACPNFAISVSRGGVRLV